MNRCRGCNRAANRPGGMCFDCHVWNRQLDDLAPSLANRPTHPTPPPGERPPAECVWCGAPEPGQGGVCGRCIRHGVREGAA